MHKNSVVIYFILTGFFFLLSNSKTCDSGYKYGYTTEYKNKKYFIITAFKANYFEATEFCRREGLDLLSVETNEEHDHLKDYVKFNVNATLYAKITVWSEHFFTSGNDLAQNRKFVWLTTGQPVLTNRWWDTEPNGYQGKQHCIVLDGPDLLYNDWECHGRTYFICELETDDSCCSSGYKFGLQTKFKDKEYFIVTTFKANFYEAFEFCRRQDLSLLSIETNEEHDHIRDYVKNNLDALLYAKISKWSEHFWTSGSDLGQNRSFVWLTTGQPVLTNKWWSTEPNGWDGKQHCLALDGPDLLYDDWQCWEETYFICQSQIKKHCQ